MSRDYAKYVAALEEQQRRNKAGQTVWTEPERATPKENAKPIVGAETVSAVEPISTLELSERLQALKRKARANRADPKAQAVLSITGLVLGPDRRVIGTVPEGIAPWLVKLLNQKEQPVS